MSIGAPTLRLFAKFRITRNSLKNFVYAQRSRRNLLSPICGSNSSETKLHSAASFVTRRFASSSNSSDVLESPLDSVTYDRVCTETLDSLCDYFEELTENAAHIEGGDVAYADGVLTINLGREYGTYVINRQSPNKQIWLSSPTSGPKRYDFVGPKSATCGRWIYKHTGDSMHELLQREIQPIFKDQTVDFMQLPYVS